MRIQEVWHRVATNASPNRVLGRGGTHRYANINNVRPGNIAPIRCRPDSAADRFTRFYPLDEQTVF